MKTQNKSIPSLQNKYQTSYSSIYFYSLCVHFTRYKLTYLKDRVTEIVHLLIHCPNAKNRARPGKSRNQNSTNVYNTDRRNSPHWPSSSVSQVSKNIHQKHGVGKIKPGTSTHPILHRFTVALAQY